MDTLKALLNEAGYVGTDPKLDNEGARDNAWAAVNLLTSELDDLRNLTDDVYFGSAADVAGRREHVQMVTAINKVRKKVKIMHNELKGDMKLLDNEISEILRPIR